MAGERTPGPWGSGHETASEIPNLSVRGGRSHGSPVGVFATAVNAGAAPASSNAAAPQHRSRFVFAGVEYRLSTAEYVGRRALFEQPVPAAEAARLLPQFLNAGIPLGLADVGGREIVDAVGRGQVVLLRAVARADSTQVEAAATAIASRRPVKDGWIEIEVKDEQGRYRSGDAYKLELPDGRVFTGTVNASGIVAFHGIDPGTAKFSLTGLDAARWS